MRLGMSGQIEKGSNGMFPASVDGGYPIIYYFADGQPCCAACASGENGSEATEDPTMDEQWRLYGADVFWEGPPENCTHCNKEIESAYGDPDAEGEGESL
jgi:hypothetical protein